ncbi:hypothetical protein ACFFX1_17260 [Dactylosporangium sucinum]|uniref:Uncharacterized protein n=1 Tax=Dactylosporangium sucinum TaxID=1424081 RepID=A0A917U4D1_9ACTN|nr:hypothetical protein [Dactylosporangium sucinum]GGM57496.1 hypothetical protein GCM10007977_068940 [Dactylosporangium sucinum]
MTRGMDLTGKVARGGVAADDHGRGDGEPKVSLVLQRVTVVHG